MRKLNQLLSMRYEDSGKNISPAKAQRRKAPRFGGFVCVFALCARGF
jgi:hypothetical protein